MTSIIIISVLSLFVSFYSTFLPKNTNNFPKNMICNNKDSYIVCQFSNNDVKDEKKEIKSNGSKKTEKEKKDEIKVADNN